MERIMDPAAVARLEAIGGTGLVRSLAALVREELPPRLQRLEEARAQRDAAALGPAAHALVSATGNFGAWSLAELARSVEQRAPAANWDVLDADVARLQASGERFLAELAELEGTAPEDARG
jgi:HPt (histidine-containing phosphotransfer) domain-containing protein